MAWSYGSGGGIVVRAGSLSGGIVVPRSTGTFGWGGDEFGQNPNDSHRVGPDPLVGSLKVDPSTTAWAQNSGTTIATTLSPPVGALLIVGVAADGGSDVNPTLALTNTGGAVTWTKVADANRTTTGGTTGNDGVASMFWGIAPGGSITITATQTAGASPTFIRVLVLTGYDLGGATTGLYTSQTPVSTNTDSAYTLGTVFSVSAPVPITAVRYWKAGTFTDGSTRQVGVWNAAGTLIATGSRVQSPADPIGWVTVPLDVSPTLATGTTYTVGVQVPASYVSTSGGYGSTRSNGVVSATVGAGVFIVSDVLAQPTSTFNNSDYFVDPVVVTGTPSPIGAAAVGNANTNGSATGPAVTMGTDDAWLVSVVSGWVPGTGITSTDATPLGFAATASGTLTGALGAIPGGDAGTVKAAHFASPNETDWMMVSAQVRQAGSSPSTTTVTQTADAAWNVAVSGGGGGGGTITLTAGTSTEGTASATSTTVALPTMVDGDYCLMVVSVNVSSGGVTTPAGWTDILPSTDSVNGSTSDHLWVGYRKYVPGDPSSVAVTTASGRVAATPIRVEGADASTFVDATSGASQLASAITVLTAPSVTPTTNCVLWVVNGRSPTNGNVLTPFTSPTQTLVASASGKATTATNAGHAIMANTAATPSAASGTASATANVSTTGAIAVTFSLKAASASLTSVTATASSAWSLRAVVSQSAPVAWTVRAAVTQTASSAWSARAQVSATKASAWSARASISSTVSSAWSARAAVTSTRAAAWSVRAALTQTAPSAWTVRTPLTQSASSAWTVRTVVTQSAPSAWTVRTTTQQSAPSAWNVRTRVQATTGSSWTVRAALTQSAGSAWAVRAQVTATAGSAWNVQSALTSVTGTASSAWSVRSQVSQTRGAAWNARALVQQTVPSAWAVRSQVSQTKAAAWSVVARLTDTAPAAWSIRASVTATTASAWSARASVTATTSSAWSVLTPLTASTASAWSVTGRATTSASTSWAVLTTTPWLNHATGKDPRNGTASRTISFGFTAGTGTLLVFMIYGAVTNTVSTGGWTERLQPVSSGELSVFTKTAAGDTSITVTNNAADYPEGWAVYEFPVGSAYASGSGTTLSSDVLPSVSGLSGTSVVIAGLGRDVNTVGSTPPTITWGSGFNSDADLFVDKTTNDAYWFVTGWAKTTASTSSPSVTVIDGGAGLAPDREAVSFAIALPAPVSSVTATVGSGWNVRAQVQPTAGSAWTVRSQVSTSKAAAWSLVGRITASASAAWNVQSALVPVSSTRGSAWSVRQAVSTSAPSAWGVRATVQRTAGAAWSVRAQTTASAVTAWSVRSSVTATRSVAFSVNTSLTAFRASAWSLTGRLTATQNVAWNVQSTLVSVTASRGSSWSVVGRISAVRGSAWTVRATLTATQGSAWSVLTPLTASKASAWAIRASVQSTKGSAWALRSQVTGSALTAWTVRATLTAQQPASWTILVPLSQTTSTAWNVRQQATGLADSAWQVFYLAGDMTLDAVGPYQRAMAGSLSTRSMEGSVTGAAITGSLAASNYDGALTQRTLTGTGPKDR